jgi:hypothetical protein
MVDSPPELLGRSAGFGHRAFRTSESFGSSGIWLLCWLDAALGSSSVDLGALRESLILALIELRTLHQRHTIPRFAPVFDAADGLAHICLQTERLRMLFADIIREPSYGAERMDPCGLCTNSSTQRSAAELTTDLN